MRLRYEVVTSGNRMISRTAARTSLRHDREIEDLPGCKVEVLIPDFRGDGNDEHRSRH